MVDAVAFEPAVAEDFPVLHAGEDVLDTGADMAVGGVVFVFPVGQFVLAAFATVQNEDAGAAIAAVADHPHGAGQAPGLAVVAIAGDRAADRNDQAGVANAAEDVSTHRGSPRPMLVVPVNVAYQLGQRPQIVREFGQGKGITPAHVHVVVHERGQTGEVRAPDVEAVGTHRFDRSVHVTDVEEHHGVEHQADADRISRW